MRKTKDKILVVLPLDKTQKNLLESKAQKADFIYRDQKTVPETDVKEASIIIGNVKGEFLKDVPNLKWLQLDSAGSDQYAALPVFKEEKALLTNASGSYGLVISEYMIGAAILMSVGFHTYRDQQLKHEWKKNGLTKTINGTQTLVVGLGDIGSNFARRMNALGSSVTAVRRTKTSGDSYVKSLHTVEDLDELLPNADIVAVCLPNSKETQNLFDSKAFSLMKERSFFINVGRGTTVDAEALAAALKSNHLGGAVIDVTNPEPLPENHPLWDCENAIITPHIAGLDEQKDAFGKIVNLATRNLENFMNGKKLESSVDLETGYRKI
jgi:phosphoglycerate dehydrogenase-like enzyme